MLTKVLNNYWSFRHQYPNLLPQSIVHQLRPWLWYGLDLITLNRGCQVKLAGQWPLQVEWRRKANNDFEQWEREFIQVYSSNLLPNDIVLDVGAEFGEWAALAATRTRSSQIHIFEPNQPAWSRIRKIWQHNRLETPGGCWNGFVSNQTSNINLTAEKLLNWPEVSQGEVRFESLLKPGIIPSITIDDYVQVSGVKPTVIMMDVEGAEVLALEGAMVTLSSLRPIVFLSFHPTMIPEFERQPDAVMKLFSSLGFQSHLISIDHEEHWVFWDSKLRTPVLKKL